MGLAQEYGELPDTLTAVTGGGGVHYFFKYPGFRVKCSTGKLGPGLDVKAEGGYVVASPSLHVSGTRYMWEASSATEPADAPEWLLNRLREPEPRQSTGETRQDAIPEGARNSTLTSLAGSLRRSGLVFEAIKAALLAENVVRCRPPLSESEVTGIAESVCRYDPGPQKGAAAFPLTDLGNCERFVAEHGKDVRYVPAWKKWLIGDNVRWQLDETLEVERRAKTTARHIYSGAGQAGSEQERKSIASWAMQSESDHRLSAMLRLAESAVTITPGELDTDPYLLCCKNGVLDLRTGELLEPRRDNYITKQSGTRYDPDAQYPLWLSFLERVLPEPELREYVQKAVVSNN